MNRFIVRFVALLIAFQSSIALGLVVNGELKKAGFELLSSTPTCNRGWVYYDTDDDEVKFCNGTVYLTIADSSNAVTNPMDSAGDMIVGGALGAAAKLDSGVAGQRLRSAGAASPTWGWFSSHSVSSAGYTITDTDGYDIIYVSTAGSDRTVVLPTLSDNIGRVLTVSKTDSGSGYLLLDGESAETVGGLPTLYMTHQGESFTVQGVSGGWMVVSSKLHGFFEAAASSALTAGIDDYNLITGCSFALPPGTWEIGYSVSGYINTTTTSSAIGTAAILEGGTTLAANSTAGILANSTRSADFTAASVTSVRAPMNMAAVVRVSPTSTTTYALMGRANSTSSIDVVFRASVFTGGLTDPDSGTVLWARRVH